MVATRASKRQGSCKHWHIPYLGRKSIFSNVRVVACRTCNSGGSRGASRGFVPELLLSNLQIPPHTKIVGCSRFVEAQASFIVGQDENVATARQVSSGGEELCVFISKRLVFLQYELHTQFVSKMKVCALKCLRVSTADPLLYDTSCTVAMLASVSVSAFSLTTRSLSPQCLAQAWSFQRCPFQAKSN